MQTKHSGWRLTLTLFFITSIVESFVMSHVFSFLPLYLQGMDVHRVAFWVGILNALMFLIGLPLVPLWGVWADKFGGKAVIIRSAYVEMLVFLILGLSRALPGVMLAMAFIGLQLGNTGIMLASIRRLVPGNRIGFAVSLFSVSSPIGMAVGPLFGGWFVKAANVNLHTVFLIDAALSFLAGTMLLSLYREWRTESHVSSATESGRMSVWNTAWRSVHFTFSLRITWVLFGIYTVLMIARQMVNPYLPMAIEQLRPMPAAPTVVIGIMMGLTALVGAVIAVVAGRLGDSMGFTRVLSFAFLLSVPCTFMMAVSHGLIPFAVWMTGNSAAVSISGAMIFSLLSTRVPDSHRSTALNLVYLPLYAGGIVGPAIASSLSHFGATAPFVGASLAFVCGLAVILRTLGMRRSVVTDEDAVAL